MGICFDLSNRAAPDAIPGARELIRQRAKANTMLKLTDVASINIVLSRKFVENTVPPDKTLSWGIVTTEPSHERMRHTDESRCASRACPQCGADATRECRGTADACCRRAISVAIFLSIRRGLRLHGLSPSEDGITVTPCQKTGA